MSLTYLPEYGIEAEKAFPAPDRAKFKTGEEYAEACRIVHGFRCQYQSIVMDAYEIQGLYNSCMSEIIQNYYSDRKIIPLKPKPSLFKRIKTWLKGLVF